MLGKNQVKKSNFKGKFWSILDNFQDFLTSVDQNFGQYFKLKLDIFTFYLNFQPYYFSTGILPKSTINLRNWPKKSLILGKKFSKMNKNLENSENLKVEKF